MVQIRELERGLEERNRALEAAIARMSRDLKAAARVQAALLPQEVPNRPGVSFGWAFRPCDELAGDGLNIVWLDETLRGIVRPGREWPRRGVLALFR